MHNRGTEETGLYLEFGGKQLMTQKLVYTLISEVFFSVSYELHERLISNTVQQVFLDWY